MPTPTDRLGLNTYDPGESWDHTDTVESLDELAIQRDTIANRPASGEYDDELFLATDQRILYQYDQGADDWEAVSGLGVDGDPVSGTSYFEALEADASRIAKTHVPESTDDIQTFINNNSGLIVDLAGQTFEVSSPLSVPDETTLRNGTIKLADGADSDLFQTENPKNVTLENIVWDLNGSNQTLDSGPDSGAYWRIYKTSGGGGEDTDIRNCRWINGSGRVSSRTLMVYFWGGDIDVINPTMRLGSEGDVLFESSEQMRILNPRIDRSGRIEFRGSDGLVSGGILEYNDIAISLQDNGLGDWIFGGGLIIEDNRQGVNINTPIKEYNIVSFGDVQFQGQEEQAVFVGSGANSGRLIIDGPVFKRNGFESDGGFPHIDLVDGNRVVLRNLSATNNSSTDGDHFIRIQADADNTILDGIDAQDSDFVNGAIQDNGNGTQTGSTFTT